MRELYPAIEPYHQGFLKVSDLHTIYFEESGNPQGHPVIILHGGPGGGSQPIYRQYFDTQRWRIVQFDQVAVVKVHLMPNFAKTPHGIW